MLFTWAGCSSSPTIPPSGVAQENPLERGSGKIQRKDALKTLLYNSLFTKKQLGLDAVLRGFAGA